MGQRVSAPRFDSVEKCSVLRGDPDGEGNRTAVADLNGTLLISKSSFPYFMLVALEAGSLVRAVLLLLLWPLVVLLAREDIRTRILVFVAFAGLRESEVVTVARAVLPKFYLEDMNSKSYEVLVSCRRRYVVTETPTVMVRYFLQEYVGVERVLGTELHKTDSGFFTGFLAARGLLNKANAVKGLMHEFRISPDVGMGDDPSDYDFLKLCKEAYIVPSAGGKLNAEKVTRERYLRPLVFHDGRMVMRPTPWVSLLTFIWMPVGIVLATVRIAFGLCIPIERALPLLEPLGVQVRMRGTPPGPPAVSGGRAGQRTGTLFVCNHRTLLDPVFISIALRRRVTAVAYSISRASELVSPIKTSRLSRRRSEDAKTVRNLLQEREDLVICPEGTTCREPYLLRFSRLFAELGESIVPVAVKEDMTMFHGTSARGWKCLDPLFFFMNPNPRYEIIFLDPLPCHVSCAAGKSSIDVANHIQKQIARTLGFQCTALTRKDKYMLLAGNDGTVPSST